MKVVIFGATGSIGNQLVIQALSLGYEVTAFVRNPQKINDLPHSSLTLIEGDVLHLNDVQEAVKGHDAVFCALGAGRNGGVRAEGTRNIIKAMHAEGVNRLICQTTLGAGDSWTNLNFFWKYIMFGWFLKEAFKDHEIQEGYIFGSRLGWTVIRPGAFTDGPLTGIYKHGFSVDEKNTKLKISRADVADFMLKQLKTDEYLHKTPGLSY
ncbi:SDR family oxidoreductase [Fulvivirga sp. 29W222]|uniref:SDR family oxidoreductase n=1 Tax=Fulvivirga marina TaxID=2494733 RepID=A0A937G3H2_9BACT|nr:SDR family oxidoreductase [Fulvivirga marina]MBL6449348.1 SDR family oxidoreductase [Fulvivirga marina]